MHHELAKLIKSCATFQHPCERRAVVVCDQPSKGRFEPIGRRWSTDRWGCPAQRKLERFLHPLPCGEQPRVPFPVWVDIAERSVVQLVAAVRREMEIIVAPRVTRWLTKPDRLSRATEHGNQFLGQGTPRRRENRRSVRSACHRVLTQPHGGVFAPRH